MENNLRHVKDMVKRQSTPGSAAIILMAVLLFGPKSIDMIRGEPWIDNRLLITQTSQGITVIEDTTITQNIVNGLRVVTAESPDGTVVCRANHINTWLGEKKQFWRVEAFIGCPQPKEAYRICSFFVARSESGRERSYGPFCSSLTLPAKQVPPEDQ